MSSRGVEERALRILRAFEGAGKPVKRVAIDGKRIELEFANEEDSDEFDKIDMRHGET